MISVRCSRFLIRFAVILLSALLLPQFAFAKRLAPGNVEPVVYGGIRYVAPNNDGCLDYVEAWNVGTNQKRWELTFFTNHIDPIRQRNGATTNLEEDVQRVFIKTLNIQNGKLWSHPNVERPIRSM